MKHKAFYEFLAFLSTIAIFMIAFMIIWNIFQMEFVETMIISAFMSMSFGLLTFLHIEEIEEENNELNKFDRND